MDTVTAEEARALLAQDRQVRELAAKAALDKFLVEWQAEFRVQFEIGVIVTARGNVPRINIIAE